MDLFKTKADKEIADLKARLETWYAEQVLFDAEIAAQLRGK